MKVSELNKFPYLMPVIDKYPDLKVFVDDTIGLVPIEELDKKNPYKYIHREFRIRNIALMKGYSGEYEEQEQKLNSGAPHDSEFWMYKEETARYRKDQIIKFDKAIIF